MSTPPPDEGRPGTPQPDQGNPWQPPPERPASAPYPPAPSGAPGRSRPEWLVPVAVIAVLAVVGIAAVVVAVMFLGRGDPDGATADPPREATSAPATSGPAEPETPDTRAVSTQPLGERVPGEITDVDDPNWRFALSEAGWGPDDKATAAGAREAMAGTFTDGSTEIPVTAAAFDTIAAQDAYTDQLVAELADAGYTELSQGPAYSDGTGRHWAYLHDDEETITIVWRTDDGVVLTATGPGDVVDLVYGNMLI